MINLDNLFTSAGYDKIYFDNQLVDKVYFDDNLVYERCVQITLPSTITSAFSSQTYSVINEDTLTTGITESVSSSNLTNYYRAGKNVYIKPTSTPKRIIKVGNIELPYHNSSSGVLTTTTILSTAKSIGSFSSNSVLTGTLSNYIVSCSLSYDSSISSRGQINSIRSNWGQASGSYTGTFYTKGGSTLAINYLATKNANTALYSYSSNRYSLLSAPPTSASALILRTGSLSVPNTTSSFSTKLFAAPFYWLKISNKTGNTISINNKTIANNATSTVSWYNVDNNWSERPYGEFPDLTSSYISPFPTISCPSYVTYSWNAIINYDGSFYDYRIAFDINTTLAGTDQVVPSITLLSSSSNIYPNVWSVYANSAGKFGYSYTDLESAKSQRTYFMYTNQKNFCYKPTNAATIINNKGYIKVTFDGAESYIVDATSSTSETDTLATAASCHLSSSLSSGDRYTLSSSSVYPAADYVYVWISKGGTGNWTAQISNRLPFAITVQYATTKLKSQSVSGVTLSTINITGGTYDNPSQEDVTITDQPWYEDIYAAFRVIRWYPRTTTIASGSNYLSRNYKWFYIQDGGVAEILTM